MNKRFDELDSLRGLAASSVLISHLFATLPSIYVIDKLQNTPFHIFWAGHEAVILFFILSGFVLSLPYHHQRAPKYKDYIIRRAARIYIPYIASILVSVGLMNLFSRMPIPELSKLLNSTWITSLSTESLFLNHVLFLGDFESQNYNPVVWSLIHEMRISIVFPLLIYFVIKLDWRKNIAIGLGCTMVYFITWYAVFHVWKYNPSYLITIHYIAFFIMGALLAKHRQVLRERYTGLSAIRKAVLLLIGVLAYTYSWWFLPSAVHLHFTVINDWIVAIGSSIFIIFSMNSNMLNKILLWRPIHFIGKSSYSLYLFHMPVLLTLVNIFHGKIPIGTLLIIAFVSSFIVSGMMYYGIEKPSIALGKAITNKKISGHRHGVQETEKQFVS